MIEPARLRRRFGRGRSAGVVAVDDVTLRIFAGRVTGLLGPNGSGKTTLLRILAGILRADGGRAWVAGCDLATRPGRARACLGFLTQEPALPDGSTPLRHVALHVSLHGFPRRVAVERARRALARTGVAESSGAPNGTLSRGVRARVALARAIAHDPQVLLLDEPTAGLDIEAAWRVRCLLAALAREGRTVLLSTHDPREAEDLCHDAVVLRAGKVLASATPAGIRSLAARPGADHPSLEEAYRFLQRQAP